MIIVTGSSGKVGRAVVKDLMERGHKVAALDTVRPAGQSNPPKPGDVRFTRVDIADFGQVMAALTGIDTRVDEPITGIVHLGAIASPGEAPDHVTFEVNMMSTYNVFEAARRLGIHNVVWASSETLFGIPYANGPEYVPVDENIATPEWSYSLSKYLGEKMAEQICRWDGDMKIICLRLSNVQEPADYANFVAYNADPLLRHTNLWTYIDARDAAQAVRLSLAAELKGAHVFGIANNNSVMSRSNDELLAAVYPNVKRTRALLPNESLISIEKAKRVLGFSPEHDWFSGE